MEMVQTAFLADHADTIPTLARWFQAQWPAYYAQQTLSEIEQGFRVRMNRDRLPIGLVTFHAGELAGTIVLREQAIETHPQYRPGLGGLYVSAPLRGCGVGTELVRAGMVAARELGYEVVYTTTQVAGGILMRLGWSWKGSILHRGERHALYWCALTASSEHEQPRVSA